MHLFRRVVLVALMLFSFIGIFTVLATPALAATSNRATTSSMATTSSSGPTCSHGNCCSGEFCCWPQGQTPLSCSTTSEQPTSVTQPQQGFVYNEGLKAGKKAGENDPVGASGKCPKDDPIYCAGWEEGYKAAQEAKAKAKGQGGPSLLEGIPPILKVLGIVAGLIAIVWLGAALAGLSLAGAAATGIRAGMVLARAAARFLSKNP